MSSENLWANAAFALMGGVVREFLKKNPTLRFFNFFVGGVVGMFTGMVVYFVAHEYGWSENMTAAMCGMAGFIGPRLLEELIPMLKRSGDMRQPQPGKRDGEVG